MHAVRRMCFARHAPLAGNPVSLLIPRLARCPLPFAQQPGARRRAFLAGRNHRVDEADLQGVLRLQPLALREQRRGRVEADQPREPLRAATAGQQAEADLGKAETRLGIVAGDPVMAGERQFQPAPERRTIEGGGDGLAGRFHVTQKLVPLQHPAVDMLRLGGPEHPLEVGAGDETLLGRGDEQTLHRGIAQRPVDRRRERLHRRVVEHVLGAVLHVPLDGRNAVPIDAVVDHLVPLDEMNPAHAMSRRSRAEPLPERRERSWPAPGLPPGGLRAEVSASNADAFGSRPRPARPSASKLDERPGDCQGA